MVVAIPLLTPASSMQDMSAGGGVNKASATRAEAGGFLFISLEGVC